jgi:hypothetical protein
LGEILFMSMKLIILTIIIALSTAFSFAGINQWTGCASYGLAIAVSPSNPKIVYISGGNTLGGGYNLYRSIDGGNSYTLITTFGGNIQSISIDPNNSSLIYLGKPNFGFYKTINACSTFSFITTGLASPYSTYPITIDPHNSNILYAGLVLSKSTDYGETWSQITNGMPWPTSAYALALDPNDSQILYCAGGGNVFKSINGGDTWSTITIGLPGNTTGYDGIAVDPLNPKTLYICTNGAGSYFYKSTTGGSFWMGVGKENGLTEGVNSFMINPVNHNCLYIASQFGGIYQSLDGASTWTYFGPNAIAYQLAMSVSDKTTLIIVGQGTWCYTFIDTAVPDNFWKQLDLNILEEETIQKSNPKSNATPKQK